MTFWGIITVAGLLRLSTIQLEQQSPEDGEQCVLDHLYMRDSVILIIVLKGCIPHSSGSNTWAHSS